MNDLTPFWKHSRLALALLSGLALGACDKASDIQKEIDDSGAGDQPAAASSAPASVPASAAADAGGGGVAALKAPVELLHANDLDNWTFDLEDPNGKIPDVWSVKDGVLSCKGRPAGVLRTKEDYSNYVMDVEWRWPPGTEGGNNGVLVHSSTPRTLGIWPRSIEVQLKKDDAGDFWIIGTTLHVPNEETRKQGRRHINLTDGSEKPMGEWNHMEITCRGNEVIVKVNGTLVNHATDCNVTSGAICLQSEGAPIEYRNVRLRPLP